jgi:hypothetical protein
MNPKAIAAWTLFLAAITAGLQAVCTWFTYQQLQIARQQAA